MLNYIQPIFNSLLRENFNKMVVLSLREREIGDDLSKEGGS